MLPTGREPAQVAAADLDGDGRAALIIRNAGDGTVTIYRSDGLGGFLSRMYLVVGPGISDLAVADVNQDGRGDLLLTDQNSGTVLVLLNQGDGSFGPPTRYRAGTELPALVGGDGTSPLAVSSAEETAGIAAGSLTQGGPVDLVALDPGTEAIGILAGVGDGRFANATNLPIASPATIVRVADLNGDGVPDLAILGPDGVTVALADGRGGFGSARTFDAGIDPTGLTIADINGDGVPDLVVGNAFGDALVLLGDGIGNFQPASSADQGVALALSMSESGGPPSLVFGSQALDRVVVQNSGAREATILSDRTTGLRVPRAVLTADLNGDEIPDLIVADGGGNRVNE
jgi:hypothetical protein